MSANNLDKLGEVDLVWANFSIAKRIQHVLQDNRYVDMDPSELDGIGCAQATLATILVDRMNMRAAKPDDAPNIELAIKEIQSVMCALDTLDSSCDKKIRDWQAALGYAISKMGGPPVPEYCEHCCSRSGFHYADCDKEPKREQP